MRFYGNECKHYTTENTTPVTRVSFDFRVIPARLFTNVTQQHIANSIRTYRNGECGQKRKACHNSIDQPRDQEEQNEDVQGDQVRLWCGGKPRGAKPLLEGEYYLRMCAED